MCKDCVTASFTSNDISLKNVQGSFSEYKNWRKKNKSLSILMMKRKCEDDNK